VHELGERAPDLPMLDHKALWGIIRCSGHGLDMCAIFSFASHPSESAEDKGEVWDPQAQVFSITLPHCQNRQLLPFTVSPTGAYGKEVGSEARGEIYIHRGEYLVYGVARK
jgi:hypothetical protein